MNMYNKNSIRIFLFAFLVSVDDCKETILTLAEQNDGEWNKLHKQIYLHF